MNGMSHARNILQHPATTMLDWPQAQLRQVGIGLAWFKMLLDCVCFRKFRATIHPRNSFWHMLLPLRFGPSQYFSALWILEKKHAGVIFPFWLKSWMYSHSHDFTCLYVHILYNYIWCKHSIMYAWL
jgi:hypothetical protein